jgi:hypothetical protein
MREYTLLRTWQDDSDEVAMSGMRSIYRSYLLRLWQARSGERAVWRASLESPHTGERRAFASLEQLTAFLQQQLGPAEDTPSAPADDHASHD